MHDITFIIIAFLLVLMNAFFVAAEFGMVRLRHTRVAIIKKRYKLQGNILYNIHKHLDAYLSACQLGITLASIGLGWIGEPAVAHVIQPLFYFLGLQSEKLITIISFFLAFSIISFLHIVIGELMPKSLAIRQSARVSLWTAVPLYLFYWLMYPAIWLLNTCSNYFLKQLHLDSVQEGEHFYSSDEIKLILNTSHLHGELTKDEADILEHTLDFADLKVAEVMRPFDEIVMLYVNQPMVEMLKVVIEGNYSRYPIYDEHREEILGIIHIKDLFATFYQEAEIKNIKSLIRPVLKVTQRTSTLELLRRFREGMPHFAIVYRGTEAIGFVTLDNLLHILIGRIKDEFHRTQDDWRINSDGSLTVRGDCSVFSLERALNRDVHVGREKIETVGALIIHRLGRLPDEGERIDFKEFKAWIERVRGHRIIKIKISPKTKPTGKD